MSAQDVGEGLSKTAAVLQQGGANIQESAALFSGIQEVLQDPSTAGNALKIITLRIRSMKGELEELGEEVDDNIDSVSKVQTQILNYTGGKVNIFDEEGNYRDIYDILKDIATVYDSLSETDQAGLLETIAGKSRASSASALIQNWSQVEKALDAANNAAGTATEENEVQLNTIEAKVTQLKASAQSLATDFGNSDAIKFFIDLLRGGVNVVDGFVKALGGIPTAIGLIVGAMSAIKDNGIIKRSTLRNLFSGGSMKVSTLTVDDNLKNTISDSDYAALYKYYLSKGKDTSALSQNEKLYSYVQNNPQIKSAQKLVNALQADPGKSLIANSSMDKSIGNVISLIKTYNEGLSELKVSQEDFSKSVATGNQDLGGYLSTVQSGSATFKGYIGYLAQTKTATLALNAATTALNMVFSSLIAMGVSKFFELVANLFDAITNGEGRAMEEAEESYKTAKEQREKTSTNTESLTSYVTQYTDIVADGEIDANELSEVQTIQSNINSLVGDQANGIDLVNGKISEQLEKLKEVQAEYANDKDIDYENAFLQASSVYNKAVGETSSGVFGYAKGYEFTHILNSDIEKLPEEYQKYFSWISGEDVRTKGLKLEGNAQERMDTAQAMLDWITENADQFEEENYAAWTGDLTNTIAYYKDFVDSEAEELNNYLGNKLLQLDTSSLSKIKPTSTSSYKTYLNQLYGLFTSDEDIQQMIKNGTMSNNDILDYINQYMSTLDGFSQYYDDYWRQIKGEEPAQTILSNDQVDEMFGTVGGLRDWYDALPEGEKRIVYSIEMSGEDVPTTIDAWSDAIEDEQYGFEDLMSEEDSDTTEAFSTKIDTYTSKMETLQSALKSFNNGELKENSAEWQELIKEFPELAGQYDNLTNAIESQMVELTGADEQWETYGKSAATGIMAAYREAYDSLETDEAKAQLNDYMNTVLEVAGVTQEAWNKISFQTFTDNISTATEQATSAITALSTSMADGGLSLEFDEDGEITGDIKNIIDAYKDLDGYDMSKLFVATANGIQVNRDELQKLQKTANDNTMAKFADEYTAISTKLSEARATLRGMEDKGSSEYTAQQSYIDTLEQQLTEVDLLSASYQQLTSDYQAWINAQSYTGGDMYDNTQSNLEGMEELYNNGEYGVEFQAGVQAFSNKDLSDASVDEYVAEYEEVMPRVQRYLTEDNTGVGNFLEDLAANVDSVTKSFDEAGNAVYDFGEGINTNEVADKLGLNVELIEGILEKLRDDYGFDITFFTDEEEQQIDEANAKIEEAKSSLSTAFEGTEYSDFMNFDDANASVEELDAQIEKGQTLLDEIDSGDTKVELNSEQVEQFGEYLDGLIQKKAVLESADTTSTTPTYDTVETGVNDLTQLQERIQQINSLNKSGQIDFTIDISGDEKVQELATEIASLPPEVKTSLGFETEDTAEDVINKLTADDGKAVEVPVELKDDDATVEVNTDEASGKVDSIQRKLDNISSKSPYTATVSVQQSSTVPQEETTTVTADTGDADKAIANVTGKAEDLDKSAYTLTVNANIASALINLNLISSLADSINGKSVGINVNANVSSALNSLTQLNAQMDAAHLKKISYGFASGTLMASGVSYAHGTAYASGSNIGLRSDAPASLVNELGYEVISRQGEWFVANGGNPGLVNLKRGDIVFSHEQSEEILKTGSTTGQGKVVGSSFADGTIGGKSFAIAKGGGTLYKSSSTSSGGSEDTSESVSEAAADASQAASDVSSASETSNDTNEKTLTANEKFSNWVRGLFDWIEVKIDRIERKISNASQKAEDYFSMNKSSAGRRMYNRTMNLTADEITTQQRAADKYLAMANKSIQHAVNLGMLTKGQKEDIVKKMKNGTLDISEYVNVQSNNSEENSGLISALEQYQTWYEKALDAKDSVQSLNSDLLGYASSLQDALQDYAEALANIPVEKAQKKIETANNNLDIYENMQGGSAGRTNNLLGIQNKYASAEYNAYQDEANTEAKSMRSAKNKVRRQLSNRSVKKNKTASKLFKKVFSYIKSDKSVPEAVITQITNLIANKSISSAVRNQLTLLLRNVNNWNANKEAYDEASQNASMAALSSIQTKIENIQSQAENTIEDAESKATFYNNLYTYTATDKNRGVNADISANREESKAEIVEQSRIRKVTRSASSAASSAIRDAQKSNSSTATYKKLLKRCKQYIAKKKYVPVRLLNKIKKYSNSVYNKLLSYNQALAYELDNMSELESEIAENITAIINDIDEKYENLASENESKTNLLEAQSENLFSATDKNKNLKQIIKNLNKNLSNNAAELRQYQNALYNSSIKIGVMNWSGSRYDSSLSKSTRKKVASLIKKIRKAVAKNADIAKYIGSLTKYHKNEWISDAFYQACITYYDNYQKYLDQEAANEIAEEEAITQKRQYAKEAVENVNTEYEYSRKKTESRLSNAQSAQSLRNTFGAKDDTSNLSEQIGYIKDDIASLEAQREAVREEIDKQLRAGNWTVNSQEYIDAMAEYDALQDDINSKTEDYIKTMQNLRQLKIDKLEAVADALETIKDNLDDINNLADVHGNTATIENLSKEIATYNELIENAGKTQNTILTNMYDWLANEFVSLAGSSMSSADSQSILKYFTAQNIDGMEEIFEKYGLSYSDLDAFQDFYTEYWDKNSTRLGYMVSQESALDSIFDNYETYLSDYKEYLQDIHDAEENALELQKAQYEYDKAVNEKTVRTWNGTEWVYASDSDAVKNAQENLDDIKYNQMIEGIDKMVDYLEDIKNFVNIYDDDGNVINPALLSNLDSVKEFAENLSNTITGGWQKSYEAMISVIKQAGFNVAGAATGGVIGGRDNDDRSLIRVSSMERVLTAQQNAAFESLVDAITDSSIVDIFRGSAVRVVPNTSATNNLQSAEVNQTFNITLPNINDASTAQQLMNELQNISLQKIQYFNTH